MVANPNLKRGLNPNPNHANGPLFCVVTFGTRVAILNNLQLTL